MNYYSLLQKSPRVNFKEALFQGQAPDGGLYFPDHIPLLNKNWLGAIKNLEKEEIALEVMKPYVGKCIPEDELYRICEETCSFSFPLVNLNDRISCLELFHGPTMAFKDVGARFMSRCLSWFVQHENREVTVLVATSGDTGAAVANGFSGLKGVNVVVLYPSGKVSRFQELQMTSGHSSVTALEVSGTFDDCQRMVKEAFADTELKKRRFLTSANSINVARWLPQQIYYFLAYKDWPFEKPPVFSVPSGNFGNICSGLVAHASGLPVQHFIAACNRNKVFPDFMESGVYTPAQSVPTISSAMDVGDPSNFKRVLELFHHNHAGMTELISSYSVTDHRTAEVIWDVHHKYGYLMDPHGAVAFECLQTYLDLHPGEKGIFMETAHPAKFGEIMESTTGVPIAMPSEMRAVMKGVKQSTPILPGYNDLRNFLWNKD